MPVKDIFSRGKYLDKFSHPGPLLRYFDPFSDWLELHGFSLERKQKHLTNIAHFNYFLTNTAESRIKSELFTFELVKCFLDHFTSCRCKWWKQDQARNSDKVNKSIKRFCKYLSECHQIFIIDSSRAYLATYQKYQTWMREKRLLAKSTVNLNSCYINKFLSWFKETSKECDLKHVKVKDIERFLLEDFEPLNRSGKRPMQTALRSFLDFCYETRIISHPMKDAVPTVKRCRLSTIPKAIKENDSIIFIKSIDQTIDTGKRLYAICLLLLEYGVRGCQVRNLQHKDINWKSQEIHFPAYKGGKSTSYPLTKEAGNAILNYLQNSRPKSHYQEIFLMLRAPYAPLSEKILTQNIDHEMNKAGINPPHKGSHCFRHAFVARMLKQGEPFKHIADLVGHKNIQTTFIYTKIDFAALAEVALDLPEA